MSSDKIVISGVGCAIADLIYKNISFNSPAFKKFLTKKEGDGGLSPGKLVFAEELELFSDKKYVDILNEIVDNRNADVLNVGGPSLVSLILASQILDRNVFDVKFYGIAGNDQNAKEIFKIVQKTPLDVSNYILSKSIVTPTTIVFSDPEYEDGMGERTFINTIGAAGEYLPEDIAEDFYHADIACFGGTALVPQIHDNLTTLLSRARKNNCITVLNTIFDFRNQRKNPQSPWPLVDSFDDYGLIDVLIVDSEEALKISGTDTIQQAAKFFDSTDVSSFVITNGANDLIAGSNGTLFNKTEITKFPASRTVKEEVQNHPERKGDTTGCGDNFVGGIIASLALQLKNCQKGTFSLSEAISWGISAGGFSCFTLGGTYIESVPDELKNRIKAIREDFLIQIGVV